MIEVIILVTIFCIPLIIVFIKNTLWDLYFWQIKEFRWDRFWTHIRWDMEEFNRDKNSIGLKFILFSTTTLLFVSPLIGLIGIMLTYVLWTYQSFEFVQHVLTKKYVHPSFRNPRNWIILVSMLILLLLIIAATAAPFLDIERNLVQENSAAVARFGESLEIFPISDIYVLLGLLTLIGLILDLASPLIMPVFVVFTQPITMFKRWNLVRKAKRKLRKINLKLTIIAITGSQGKTTTKELVYELIKDTYKTVKTPENYNTDVGIANTILRDIKSDTEVFIAEMGAYRKGEIRNMASKFRPDISVITDIDTQHLSLFGSKEKLLKAKYEIVENLKENGVAILNGENRQLLAKSKKSPTRVVYTATAKKFATEFKKLVDGKTDFIVSDIQDSTKKSVLIDLFGQDISTNIKLSNMPKSYVSNITQAIAVANELNIPIKDIKSSLENLKKSMPRLQIDSGDNQTIVINDSYSSSRKGFISAVEEMNKHADGKSRKIVITKGILELGKHKESIYDSMMDEIAKKIDVLITSDHKLAAAAKKDNVHMEIILTRDQNEIIYAFRNASRPGDVVLLEGRLHPNIIKEIISDEKDGSL